MSRSTLWSVSFSILLQNFASFWIIPGDICTPAVVPVSDYDSVQSLCNKINHLFTYCSRCTVSQQTCSTYVFHVFKTARHSVARSAVCIWPHRAHGTGRLLWRHLGPIRLFISSKHRRFWNQHYKQHSHYKSSRYEHQHSNFVTSCLFSLSSYWLLFTNCHLPKHNPDVCLILYTVFVNFCYTSGRSDCVCRRNSACLWRMPVTLCRMKL